MNFYRAIFEGKILRGSYPKDMIEMYPNLPETLIEVTEELNNKILNGIFKINGELKLTDIYDIEDLNLFELQEEEYIDMPKSEIELLKEENETLKLALAALDNQRQQDKLDTQLAIAELTSTLMGGE